MCTMPSVIIAEIWLHKNHINTNDLLMLTLEFELVILLKVEYPVETDPIYIFKANYNLYIRFGCISRI